MTYVTNPEILVTITWKWISCCVCGVNFAMDASYYKDRSERKDSFWCPNGHGQHFTGETEAQKLRRYLNNANDRNASLLAERDQIAASRRAIKGQVTKLKKRAIAGVCAFCNRHFVNVQRHVESKHKGTAVAEEVMPPAD